MEIYFIGLCLLLIGGAGGYGIARIVLAFRSREKKLRELEQTVNELKDHRRHPNPTASGLEDALAIVLDCLQEEEASRAYTAARMNQVGNVLRMVRANPYAYNEDAPNGKQLYELRRKNITKK